MQQIISVSAPCAAVDPLAILGQSLGQERFYWADPQGRWIHVGFGLAADLQSWSFNRFEEIQTAVTKLFERAVIADDLPPSAEPHLFGGFAFSNNFIPDNTWSVYQPAQFILPHYQLSMNRTATEGNTAWLTLNALVDGWELGEDGIREVREQLDEALQARIRRLHENHVPLEQSHPALRTINYPMTFQTWTQMLRRAFEQFRANLLSKVVLSRVCEIRFEENVNVDGALSFLNSQYPNCYRFLFEPRPHHAFFGASPEMLVSLAGKELATMALAGTEPRGSTQEEDLQLGRQLLNSAKDRHEHQLVVDALVARLTPICQNLHVPDAPELLKLSNVQHLYTPVEGTLREKQNIFELVKLLHPTPALGGSPREGALAFIGEMEPVPRGWYAAPIGLINRHLEGTFSVAIRSAVAEFDRVWLHAGAGIVEASDPKKEWDETGLKFRPILNSLGL